MTKRKKEKVISQAERLEREKQNALARDRGEPLPYPKDDPERVIPEEERQERRRFNCLARDAGNPIPYPEEEWTFEEERHIKAAVKKWTKNYRSLPRGYDREDMLQDCRMKWAGVRDSYDKSKSKMNTYCFNVTKNHIVDLVRAGNTDKRKIEQFTLEYIEGVTEGALIKGKPPGDHQAKLELQFDGDSNLKYKPTGRGAKDSIKWRRENEPDHPELINRYRETGEKDLTPHNVSRINKSGDDDDILLR